MIQTSTHIACVVGSIAFALAAAWNTSTGRAAETQVPLTFSGGHEIGPNDSGRPVPLIAAALRVSPDVFREAFSGVAPAKGRGPTGDEARKNKAALLKVLGPHGVTNERLDEVSDHYRFRPQNGELWPTTEAKAHALVENGQIKRIVVTAPGAGYSSPPDVSVKGFPDAKFKVMLGYSTDFQKNGAVTTVEVLPAR